MSYLANNSVSISIHKGDRSQFMASTSFNNSLMTLPTANDDRGTPTLMRTGTAARLAGLSPSTLRIWEHRYGVVAPPKSAAGQRTYSMKDIERLRLIKRLTLEGHAIGTVAHLDVDALASLSSGNQVLSAEAQRVLVVGHAAARKLAGRLRPSPALVFDDLSHAEREVARAGAADVLVIHVSSLHASMTERVRTLQNSLPVRNVIVIYSFGAEAVAASLGAAGVTVRRGPVSGKELASLIVASRPIVAAPVGSDQTKSRLYSDAELVALSEMPSLVACECPRHLAEIVTLLVGFELYSTECAARNQNDAELHRHLHDVTSAARSMLEQALARVVVEEGLLV
jgi:MerR family transcriptional regulator, light-induced transcriptional regulator